MGPYRTGQFHRFSVILEALCHLTTSLYFPLMIARDVLPIGMEFACARSVNISLREP